MNPQSVSLADELRKLAAQITQDLQGDGFFKPMNASYVLGRIEGRLISALLDQHAAEQPKLTELAELVHRMEMDEPGKLWSYGTILAYCKSRLTSPVAPPPQWTQRELKVLSGLAKKLEVSEFVILRQGLRTYQLIVEGTHHLEGPHGLEPPVAPGEQPPRTPMTESVPRYHCTFCDGNHDEGDCPNRCTPPAQERASAKSTLVDIMVVTSAFARNA